MMNDHLTMKRIHNSHACAAHQSPAPLDFVMLRTVRSLTLLDMASPSQSTGRIFDFKESADPVASTIPLTTLPLATKVRAGSIVIVRDPCNSSKTRPSIS